MRHLAANLDRFRPMLRDARGVAMVEFALVATILIGLLLPVIDIGMGFYFKTQVMTAAQAGAQYAFRYGWDGADTSIADAITTATGLSSITPTPAPTKKTGCWILSGSNYGVNTSNPPDPCPSPNSQAPGQYVTSSASVRYTPLFNYLGFGNAVTLTASSIVRVP